MTSQPETGLPAPGPHPAPLTPAEASRLLDSIRQAEDELAETGENIAVAPVAETVTPAKDSADEAGDRSAAPTAAAAVPATAEPHAVDAEGSEREAGTPTRSATAESVSVPGDAGRVDGSSAADLAAVVAGWADASAADAARADSLRTGADESGIDSAATDFFAGEPVAVEVETAGGYFAADVAFAVDSDDASNAEGGAAEPPLATDAEGVGVEAGESANSSDVSESALAASGFVLPGDVADDIETIVHVMRHGEVHNPKGILYGRLPGFQLSVTGRAQAQAVARSLADHDIALVVASPLQRAQETAEPIALHHDLVIRTDDNLIEAGNTFEGLRVSMSDGALRKPRHWWKMRDPFTPSWGEPYLQIAHRMLAAVNKARVEAAGREAVLVSHQLPVWTLRRFLQGQRLWHDPRNRQCSLASMTSLVYQGDTLIDIVYSEPAGASDPKVTGA